MKTHNTGSVLLDEDSRLTEVMPDHPPIHKDVAWDEMRPRKKRLVKYLAIPLIAVAGLVTWQLLGSAKTPSYTYASVHRGDISKTINATGTLQALVTVQVGSQTSGRIDELYVDFNSRVHKGELIAKLDQSQAQAQLDQANANLASANAAVQTAQSAVANAQAGLVASGANRDRTQAALTDAQRNNERTKELGDAGAAPRRDVEVAEATFAQAKAQLEQAAAQVDQAKTQVLSAGSQLTQAQAQVKQAQASVEMAQVNLDHTLIRAPVDGVVIARNVDVGQTVAASLQAPVLFLIANDLTRMQVLADIDEADVGQLQPNNRVSFSVDAYPSDVFQGTISQIRLNPQTVQNVVTYTAVIDVNNPDLKLKPGMTANVTAITAESKAVLRVPNAALRFQPGNTASAVPANGHARKGAGSVVWVPAEDQGLKPVQVKLGITDGVYSELVSGDLKENERVAIGSNAVTREAATRPQTNPMMPFGGRGGRR